MSDDHWQKLGDVAKRKLINEFGRALGYAVAPDKESEQWGIIARRSGTSQFGAAEAWCKDSSAPTGLLLFATEAEARATAKDYNDRATSPNVSYSAERYR